MSTDGLRLPEPRWLTVEEAAQYTRTDEEWIREHIKAGALKCVPTARRKSAGNTGPKRQVIDRFKLDALMEALEVTVQAVKPEAEVTAELPGGRPPVKPSGSAGWVPARKRLEGRN